MYVVIVFCKLKLQKKKELPQNFFDDGVIRSSLFVESKFAGTKLFLVCEGHDLKYILDASKLINNSSTKFKRN